MNLYDFCNLHGKKIQEKIDQLTIYFKFKKLKPIYVNNENIILDHNIGWEITVRINTLLHAYMNNETTWF
jgi:hypothetical protein